MGLQRFKIQGDEHVGLSRRDVIGRKGRTGHETGIVRIAQPMGFFDRIGIDAGEGFGRHVHERCHVLLYEIGLGVVVDFLKPRPQLRLRFREVHAHGPQRLILLFRMTGEADIGDDRRQQLQAGCPKEIVPYAAGAAAFAHDPRGDRSDILFLRPAMLTDPVQGIEPDIGIFRVEHDDITAGFNPVRLDHRRHLIGWIKYDQRAAPFQRRRNRHRRGLEAAGAGEHDAM